MLTKRISQVYLTLVPFLTALLGFAVGHISYCIYLPVWIVNAALMTYAAWLLGARNIRHSSSRHTTVPAFLLVIPWMLFSLFFGLGAPPHTVAGWVATATEQQARFAILIAGGAVLTTGFALLRKRLNDTNGQLLADAGFSLLQLAMPLFMLNMAFWGNYLTETFRQFAASGTTVWPDWYPPVNQFLLLLSTVEVGLTYAATAAFAASLARAGVFSRRASRVYIAFSALGFVLNMLPPSLPEPFATAGYAVSIPAIPFLMPYLMGLNLLRKTGAGQ